VTDRLHHHLQSNASSQPLQPDLSVLVDLCFHLPSWASLRKALAGYVHPGFSRYWITFSFSSVCI